MFGSWKALRKAKKMIRKWIFSFFLKKKSLDNIEKGKEKKILMLCLVLNKFEGKCKVKKIERKSRIKEKVKKNKKQI